MEKRDRNRRHQPMTRTTRLRSRKLKSASTLSLLLDRRRMSVKVRTLHEEADHLLTRLQIQTVKEAETVATTVLETEVDPHVAASATTAEDPKKAESVASAKNLGGKTDSSSFGVSPFTVAAVL